jgi:hypothetical protein
VCFLGCEHCHNDSCLEGIAASKDVLDACVTNLPGDRSPYRLEEILIGGGEALVRQQHTEQQLSDQELAFYRRKLGEHVMADVELPAT